MGYSSSFEETSSLEKNMRRDRSHDEGKRVAELELHHQESLHSFMDGSHAEVLESFRSCKGDIHSRDSYQRVFDSGEFVPKPTIESSSPSTVTSKVLLSGMHRTDSVDRRLSERAQFYKAVGESPPDSSSDLAGTIKDDTDDDDLSSCCDASQTVLLSLEHTNVEEFHRTRRRPQWPFETIERKGSFLNRLPSDPDFEYVGICSNPPAVTKRGIERGNYSQLHRKAWLEVSDPQHRYGRNLRLYYRHWETLGFPTNNFFDWLDSKGDAQGQPLPELKGCPRSELDSDTVMYIANDEITKNYALSVCCDDKGRACIEDVDGERVKTGADGWIFVLRDNVLYGAQKITSIDGTSNLKQRFHHSSFFGGKAVTAAGIFVTDDDGFLSRLYPHSGHYRPREAALQRVLFYIYCRDVDLRTFSVDIQQLVHVSRHETSKGSAEHEAKCKKMDSLYLVPATTAAHFLSHKARLIDEGVFDEIHKLRTIDTNTLTSALVAIDEYAQG